MVRWRLHASEPKEEFVKVVIAGVSVRRIVLAVSLALGGLSAVVLCLGVHVVAKALLDETRWRTQRAKFSGVMPDSDFSSCEGCYAWQSLGSDFVVLGLCLAGGAVAVGCCVAILRRVGKRSLRRAAVEQSTGDTGR
jgi:hypothetical protein